ncbi:hypothetical protein [Pantoea vagans]|uniref:hypothetical protein n=1 Tax=Pantoea vagans TaxID=470934 RepID=UPI003FA36D32
MFQISSGKFFDENKTDSHNGEFVFYSNVSIRCPVVNEFPKFEVKCIEHGNISCYLVNYELLTEKPEKIEAGVVVRAGDQDYMAQFILLWDFYFDCIARTEKESVKKICAQSSFSTGDVKTAYQVAPYLVEMRKDVSYEKINGFKDFVKNLIELSRAGYKSVLAALKIISDSKESVSTNFDLTYSMLVYALESLSQGHDGYEPRWEDFDSETQAAMDKILLNISTLEADRIREALINGKQFKLQQRFKNFIERNLKDDFFYDTDRSSIRFSHVTRALENLYNMRSSFVHALKPIDVMISETYNSKSDYIMRFNEPYFTYSGLLKLLNEVIINFCFSNNSMASETVNWLNETSSIRVAEMAPQYWVGQASSFEYKFIYKWFGLYLDMLTRGDVIDQGEVIRKIKLTFNEAPKKFKSPLLSFYILYNYIHNPESNDWKVFFRKHESHLELDMFFYANHCFLFGKFDPSSDNVDSLEVLKGFVTCFDDYVKYKFKKNRLNFSGITEAALLLCAATSYYKMGNYPSYEKIMKTALKELASSPEVFDYVKDRIDNGRNPDLNGYFSVCRNKRGGSS